MKKLVVIIIGLALITNAFSQQKNMFSQYSLNKYWINPAVAGTGESNPLALTYKQFWTGINDAPRMYALNGHFSVGKNMGVGGAVYNYKTNPTSRIGVEGTYAYHIKVTEGTKLSLALTGMLYQNHLAKSELNMDDASDDLIMSTSDKLIVPDASFGAYYYGEKFHVGLAVHNLFNRKVNYLNAELLEARQARHYFLHGGYNFEFGDFGLEPSVLLKLIEAGVFQGDINLRCIYKKLVSLGVSYRYQEGIVIMTGLQTKSFMFGYAYDLTLSDINTVSNGSHEIMFIYKIKGKSNPPKFSE